MKYILAEQLLSRIMDWKSGESYEYINQLLYLSSVKYDGYDRFMPGARFLGSLSKWLSKFDQADREEMLDFVRRQLIFISSNQMAYLITLLNSTKIKKDLLRTVCASNNQPKYRVRWAEKQTYEEEKNKSLFVGLSDGAHMDLIRRDHELKNYQVLTNYYPSADRLEEMQEDLGKATTKGSKFESIFLIDDFTASGKSFIRYEKDKKTEEWKYKGKLAKIFDSIFTKVDKEEGKEADKPLSLNEICSPNVKVYVYFCVATRAAIDYIKQEMIRFLEDRNYPDCCLENVDMVFEVKGVDFDAPENKKLKDIISQDRFFNKKIADEHYEKGKHDYPWKGFNECSLAIVLHHNTPNNSLPVLWQPGDVVYNGLYYPSLFPRISRH